MSDLLNAASLIMIPSGYSEDKVYSAVPTDGSGDLSFTRASNGTRINSAGLVEVVPWNLLTYSNTFSNANWGLSEATVTGSQAGYDGTNNAWKLQSSGGTGTYIVQGSYSAIRTQSIYAKAGTTSKLSIIVGGYGNGMQFDLSNGTIVTNSNSSYFSGSITSVGSGWYYIVVTVQATAPTYGFLIAPQLLNGGGISVGDYIFIQNAQLNQGALAPYFPTTDRLNVPRLTYQNGGGGCPSLLLEKQSTNFIYPSNSSSANTFNGTYTANAILSPEGVVNGFSFLVTPNTPGGLSMATVATTAQSYTFSAYLKGSVNGQKVLLYGDLNSSIQEFTLTTEWVLYTKTFTGAVGTQTIYLLNGSYLSPSQNNLYYGYGLQLEASSYATSLIQTTSASATRVADACSKTGISSLIGQTSGVIFVDINRTQKSENYNIPIFVGSGNNIIQLYFRSTNDLVGQVYTSAGQQAAIVSSTLANGRYKIALAYASNDFAMYINGVQIGTDSSGNVPTCSQVIIGDDGTGLAQFNDSINQAILFPTRLTNAELASLTTI